MRDGPASYAANGHGSRPIAPLPLFGFRIGEIVQRHSGWGGNTERYRIVGPGSREISLTAEPLEQSPWWPPRGTDVEVWDLMHDTPVFHAWVDLYERSPHEESLALPRARDKYLAALGGATEALIAENPHLLIPRATWEGGQPHSWAICHRAGIVEAQAGSAARLEQVIGTITDQQIVDHLRRSAARMAAMDEMEAPWFGDEDKAILRRIASPH